MLQSALDGDGDSAAALKLWAGCACTGCDQLVRSLRHVQLQGCLGAGQCVEVATHQPAVAGVIRFPHELPVMALGTWHSCVIKCIVYATSMFAVISP